MEGHAMHNPQSAHENPTTEPPQPRPKTEDPRTNVQNPKFDDEKQDSISTEGEKTAQIQNVQNPKTDDEKQESISTEGEMAVRNQNVQNPKFDDEKAIDGIPPQRPTLPVPNPNVQNLEIDDEKPTPSQHLAPSTNPQDLHPGKVHISHFDDEKATARFVDLRSQILGRKELITRDASVVASWKTYRGKRFGPYYRVAYRENGVLRSIYIGRDEQLAKMASALIDELKQPREEDRLIRRLRAAARASLRRTLAEAEALAAPLGFRRRGFRFCKRRA
jgi:hypothetical protein